MNKRGTLLITAFLAASCPLALYAKSYELKLESPIAVGSVQLPPGPYRLAVNSSAAILRNAINGKEFEIPVTIAHSGERFKTTAVYSDATIKPERLKSIDLGGFTVRLEFNL